MTQKLRDSTTLFDRPVDEATLSEWTAQAAAPKPARHAPRTAALLVRAGVEWIGIPTSMVDAALPAGPVHSVPYLSGRAFLGLCNVDGELAPCVSLAELVGAQPGQGPASPRFIAVVTVHGRFVLKVDEAFGTCGFDPAELSSPPDTLARSAGQVVSAMTMMEGRLAGVADEEKLGLALLASLRP